MPWFNTHWFTYITKHIPGAGVSALSLPQPALHANERPQLGVILGFYLLLCSLMSEVKCLRFPEDKGIAKS